MIPLKNFQCRMILLQSYDPFINLAIEQYLLENLQANEYIFLLWRSFPSLIMGRFQNPWKEINTTELAKDGAPLVRRVSGGGCVYHDLGNLNYCFLSHGQNWYRQEHCELILDVLKSFGLEGESSDKFDILIHTSQGPKKVSGSAFKKSREQHLHHGTLLVDADLTRLRRLLKTNHKLIETKAIASRPHSVANLSELNCALNIDVIKNALWDKFRKMAGENLRLEFMGPQSLQIHQVRQSYDKLKSDLWLWGETPRFEQRIPFSFDWAEGVVHLICQKAKVDQLSVEGGYFHPEIVAFLESHLKGQFLRPNSIEYAFTLTQHEYPLYSLELKQLSNVVSQNVL